MSRSGISNCLAIGRTRQRRKFFPQRDTPDLPFPHARRSRTSAPRVTDLERVFSRGFEMVKRHSGIDLAIFSEDGCSWTCGLNVFGYRLNTMACVALLCSAFLGGPIRFNRRNRLHGVGTENSAFGGEHHEHDNSGEERSHSLINILTVEAEDRIRRATQPACVKNSCVRVETIRWAPMSLSQYAGLHSREARSGRPVAAIKGE
jgi:hypothetical protein